ncbi:polysaccharide biosynthesis/export family protein [Halomonas sp. ISL-60]|uniref:polysaccharide export protein n=1 Tax=unclassified Halomonas TaxID=2609666 RepID=UPI0007DA2958|nr:MULTISPECIES: polysaccharide export protein [unclassified Halomonas]MBT2772699.1 polysaccharide biosynthesis/export family protein [Halomonas sp. ISL-60]MBT2788177.1 polysaccharide biosynthesis/export family protein [Halomonas sp. ISL-106]MBT2795926.1 polysaccharide biosynthesis/export family protein [Halomonas sp. ISL-104]MBT2804038.1 polysaccharide biosynthesis/export family protein [Halomonas sp. ISL-56]OAL61208.1 polysaccharide export protein Wza [Halomonas sp. ALS9]
MTNFKAIAGIKTRKKPVRWVHYLTFILLLVALSGCAMAPGGHIDDSKLEQSLDGRVDVQPITPEFVDTLYVPQAPTTQATSQALNQEVQSYEYRVGPGDILSVIVYDHPELTIPAGAERSAAETGNRIRPNGTMFYPYVGRVRVEGMTLDEVRELIARRLSEVINEPQVEVGIAAFNSQKVYISGAVETPGTLPLTIVPMTVLDAISAVGGARDNADWRNVKLSRNGGEEVISLYAMMRQGDMTQNRLLRNGDLLHIPTMENQNVIVLGQVSRPGAIALGNERITLTDALGRAGGVNENRAEPSGIFVVRGNPPGSEKIATVYQLDIQDATRLLLGTRFPLQPQDVVYVTSAPLARWNSVISLLLPSVSLPGDVATSAIDAGEL